jgi:hypothetical protein
MKVAQQFIAGLALKKNGPSRRDLMKVAQHEVLGNNAKREVRPVKGR